MVECAILFGQCHIGLYLLFSLMQDGDDMRGGSDAQQMLFINTGWIGVE